MANCWPGLCTKRRVLLYVLIKPEKTLLCIVWEGAFFVFSGNRNISSMIIYTFQLSSFMRYSLMTDRQTPKSIYQFVSSNDKLLDPIKSTVIVH